VLKEVRLLDALLKDKQSQVYVPQCKLKLWVFMEKYDSPIGGHRREKFTIKWYKKDIIGRA
jgi:hypothetical protein